MTADTTTDTATATCPVGHLVVGGGASRTATQNNLASTYPSGAGTAWTAVWSGTQGDGTVYAICAPTPVVED